MQITKRLLDTRSGLSFVNKTLTPQPWKHRIQQGSLTKLRTATKQLVQVEGRILFYVRFESIHTKVWFGIVPSLAVEMLLDTSFIDIFTRGIFPFERKVVP